MDRTASAEEMAAVSLCDLPSEGLLKQVTHQDQQDYWYQLRAFYSIVSIYWRYRLLKPSAEFESFNDPLYDFREQKIIDKIHHEFAWRRVDRLQALYKVLEKGEQYIAETALDLGFNYPYTLSSLFGEINQKDADNLFKTCLQPYKNISTQSILRATEITLKLSDLQSLKPREIKQAKHLGSQLQENKLHGFAIQSCANKAQQDEQLRQLLVKYVETIGREVNVTKTAVSRTRDSKTYHKRRSFVWSKGEIVYANRYGGTYDINNDLNKT